MVATNITHISSNGDAADSAKLLRTDVTEKRSARDWTIGLVHCPPWFRRVRDESPVPPQDRVGCHDAGDGRQVMTAEDVRRWPLCGFGIPDANDSSDPLEQRAALRASSRHGLAAARAHLLPPAVLRLGQSPSTGGHRVPARRWPVLTDIFAIGGVFAQHGVRCRRMKSRPQRLF